MARLVLVRGRILDDVQDERDRAFRRPLHGLCARSSPLNWVVGSIEQRALLQAYNTGSNCIDVFVIGAFTQLQYEGQAMIPGRFYASTKRALDSVKRSVFITARTMNGSDLGPFMLAHECGHALLDAVHTADSTQLMLDHGVPENKVDGPKRVSEGQVRFEEPELRIIQEARIRTKAAEVLAEM